MKTIPQDWIDEVVKNLKARPDLFMPFGGHRNIPDGEYIEAVQKFLDMPINKEWEFDVKRYGDKFKGFFISIVTHQCFNNMHPLTCCSAHEILVPRISFKDELYLVCPTCGWIQPSQYTPVMF